MSNPEQGEWTEFYKLTGQRPAWDTLRTALTHFEAEDMGDLPKFAIDLGSGAGRDTLELIKRGWQVLAVDAQAESGLWIKTKLMKEAQAFLQIQVNPFEAMILPSSATLINSNYSLPFCSADHFPAMWQQIVDCIPAGGRFSGNFFGDHDDWVKTPLEFPTLHFSRTETEALFADFEIEWFDERDEAGSMASGDAKHWHVFNVVAQKR